MFKLKSQLIIVVMLMFGITAFVSCKKDASIIQNSTSPASSFVQDKQLTLDEFIESVETNDERMFFKEHNIVDNRAIASKAIKSIMQLKSTMAKPKIKFRWGKGGCSRPIGICLIIPIGLDAANAQAGRFNGKYVIIPKTDDNGITADGYLPVSEDLYVNDTTTIKAGIYAANYDVQQAKYTAVALDLK